MIRIDPRIKILQTLFIGIMIFVVRTDIANTVNILYLTLTLLLLGRSAGAVKFICVYAAAFLIYYLCGRGTGTGVESIVSYFAYFIIRILPMTAMAIIMTKTVTPAQLIGALQKLRIHRNLTIPFAVAIRFLPSLKRETGYIRDAMKMRGINTGFSGIKSPFKVFEYVTVPLLMRCVKITDELSASAIVRGIENPGDRTMMNELKLRSVDFIYAAFVLSVNCAILFLDKGFAS